MKIRLAAAVLTAASLLLAGCEEAHVHQYASEITVPASCAEDGTVRFSCSCGDSYTEPVPASGHAWDGGAVTEEPDCMAAGVRLFTCTLCDETKSEPIPPTGRHQYLTSVIEKPATCTEDGLASSSCSVCKEKITTAIAAVGQHSFGEAAVSRAATCGTAGESTAVCTVCGEKKTEEIPASGSHSWDAGAVTAAALCTKTGTRTYRCTVCSETKTESIPQNDVHTWDAGRITRAATCAAEGSAVYSCTACGRTKTAAVARTGVHSWNGGAVTAPATCKGEGVTTYTCTVCHTEKTESIPKTNTHSWVTKVTKEASITEEGEKTTACSVCGTVSRTEKTEKLQGSLHEPYRIRTSFGGDFFVEFTLDGDKLRITGVLPQDVPAARINWKADYPKETGIAQKSGIKTERLSAGKPFSVEIPLDVEMREFSLSFGSVSSDWKKSDRHDVSVEIRRESGELPRFVIPET